MRTSASSPRSVYSVSIPSSEPPSWAATSKAKRPSIQRGKIDAITRSPTAAWVTR